jgi:hypothetical protein
MAIGPDEVSGIVVAAYSGQSMNSARTQQAKANILGPSDLGGCRAKLAHNFMQTPRKERETPPWAAFVGTWVGEGLEKAYVAARPGSVAQRRIEVDLPSGRHTAGNVDVLDPEAGVLDFKSQDGLAAVQHDGPPFKHVAQIMCYLLGAIQMGLLPEDAQWHLVYVDRSGKESEPYVVSGRFEPEVIEEMEERISEAEHAALFRTEAPRDEPAQLCARFCEFYEACRGDWQPEGLIDDLDTVKAAERYARGLELVKEGEALKKSAKQDLAGVQGSTGSVVVRNVWVNGGTVTSTRKGYWRLDVKRVKA